MITEMRMNLGSWYRRKLKGRTMYSVNIMPVIPEDEVYDFNNTESLCYTRFKLWAWVVFTMKGWRLPPDRSIQITTLRPGQ